MMRQYYQLKAQCPEGILFFRMGDFYEVFGEEAEEIAPKLEIALTSRERGDQQRIPFCGVPHHSARTYWHRLLRLGYKVAIADQVEDAAEARGLVRRDIVRVLSPGSIDEPEGLDQEAPNYVMAALEDPKTRIWSFCFADVSTGELRLGSCQTIRELIEWLESFRPSELICRRFCKEQLKELTAPYRSRSGLLISTMPEGIQRDQPKSDQLLQRVFGTTSLNLQPCGDVPGGIGVLAALMSYLEDCKAQTRHFRKVLPLKDDDTFVLNETAVRDLELFETNRGRSSHGSLFHSVNQCISPMGARRLRSSLARPFRCKQAIWLRHKAVRELSEAGEAFVQELRSHLKGIGDIERLGSRLISGRIRPRELARIRDSLGQALALFELLGTSGRRSSLLQEQIQELKAAEKICSCLKRALLEHPGASVGDGDGLFRPGFDPGLDRYNEYATSGEKKIEEYLEITRDQTGISSLKIKTHKTFGRVLEVTKSNLSKVPDYFIRRQTMVNCERFVTDELIELDEELSSAHEKAIERERELFGQLLEQLAPEAELLKRVSCAIAHIDTLQSFSWLILTRGFSVSNLITHGEALSLLSVRHPVVEQAVGRHHFVPNDIIMEPAKKQLLITGPNMAGKSTIMRQVALCAILNQTGGVIPARAAGMPVFDGVFTRVGASDDLSKGLSTFMVEMSEAAHILRNGTSESLVILDEVGRGTSTEDGLAIASAILEFIAADLGCWTLFSTHYHELVDISVRLKSIRTVQTEVIEKDGGIRFTHRLIEGASGSSYGLEVAELAGIPEEVIKLATRYLDRHKEDSDLKKTRTKNRLNPLQAKPLKALFKETDLMLMKPEKNKASDRLKDKINRIPIDSLTPVQALNVLNELKSELKSQHQDNPFQDGQM